MTATIDRVTREQAKTLASAGYSFRKARSRWYGYRNGVRFTMPEMTKNDAMQMALYDMDPNRLRVLFGAKEE